MLNSKLGVSVCFTLFLVISAEAGNSYRTVETKNGLIRGIQLRTSFEKLDYYAFKGIPYAEKPINELRFKAPVPIKPWKPATVDALEYGNGCIQKLLLLAIPENLSEDCLFLNVFVPDNIEPDEKLAVMFFIHGGGWFEGSGEDYFFGADFLMERRVILVTLNYRLGPFGFLSLDSREYSGNMGMKDQQLALKWVYDNINSFGGDNERITIFGHSAGAASTHYHVLSEESRKYFRGAITMSGSVENFWAMSMENDHVKMLFDIAKEMGEPKQTYDELVDFMKTISVEKILKYFPTLNLGHTFSLIWTPVVERSDAVRPFIVEKPNQIYEKSKMNIDSMFAHTSHETIMFTPLFEASILNNFIESDFNLTLPFRDIVVPFDSQEYRSLADEIREFYSNKELKGSAIERYIQLSSDINFVYQINKAAKKQASKSTGKTFYYIHSVDSVLNVIRHGKMVDIRGTSHADELCYLFYCRCMIPVYEQILSNKENEESKTALQAIDNMTKLFSNFAKYGTPTHNNEPLDGVKPIEGNEVHFVELTNDGLTTGVNPNQKSNELWKKIEEKAYKITEKHNEIQREEL